MIFGGSGDLAHRKLVPALYNLALRGLLPAGFAVVGIGRSDYGGDEGYRESMRESGEHRHTQRLESGFGAVEDLCEERVADPHESQRLPRGIGATAELGALGAVRARDPRVGDYGRDEPRMLSRVSAGWFPPPP